MIQTKRGRDMLLYEGYTFTQNRMCKDGMRWQCSFPKCKAFCRMSSAGWLTPHKTSHDHPKPSEQEIKKRILRMELKARAQSSGATPGEIIRNALPAEEYQTTDQRACYTRCIQRFRKSLQRKNSKPPDEGWHPPKDAPPAGTNPEDGAWLDHDKPLVHLSDAAAKDGVKHWHQDPVHLQAPDKHTRLMDDKEMDIHGKVGPYGL